MLCGVFAATDSCTLGIKGRVVVHSLAAAGRDSGGARVLIGSLVGGPTNRVGMDGWMDMDECLSGRIGLVGFARWVGEMCSSARALQPGSKVYLGDQWMRCSCFDNSIVRRVWVDSCVRYSVPRCNYG